MEKPDFCYLFFSAGDCIRVRRKSFCDSFKCIVRGLKGVSEHYRRPQTSMQITGTGMEAQAEEHSTVLVEELVDHFDFGASFEVVWKQHDRHRHLV